MLDSVARWLISITAIALVSAIARALAEKTPAAKPVAFISGLLMILAVMSPIAEISMESLSSYVAAYKVEANEISSGIQVDSNEIMSLIIQEDTRAYILDKAKALGFECEVEVITETGDNGYPYPASVIISAEPSPEQKTALSELIESELAISQERQEWK